MFLETMVFTLFGAPSICISDNAKVFRSDIFRKLLDQYGVQQWNLAVYHPSPNPTERVNRVIVTAIRCALNDKKNHRDWDDSIQTIAMAIRTSVHDSIGYSPYFVNFGRNMISNGREYDHIRDLLDADEQPQRKKSAEMEKLYEVVRQNLAKAYQKYSQPYNLRANQRHQFEIGQLVYKKNVHLSDKSKNFVGKFGNKFSPARVQGKLGTNTYIREVMNGLRIPGSFHGSFLKKA